MMKTCSFILPGSVLCGNPALKDSAAVLCRFHVDAPQRAANAARAQAEKHLLPGRRLAISHDALRKRHLRDLQSVPVLHTFEACHAMLNTIVRSYEARVFDAATAQVMLRCLRIASTTLRVHGGTAERAQAKDFNPRLRDAVEALRIDTKLEKLRKSDKLQRIRIS